MFIYTVYMHWYVLFVCVYELLSYHLTQLIHTALPHSSAVVALAWWSATKLLRGYRVCVRVRLALCAARECRVARHFD